MLWKKLLTVARGKMRNRSFRILPPHDSGEFGLMERRYAEQYGDLEEWHWWFRARREIVEDEVRRQLPQGSSYTIVSVGCGPPEGGLSWLQPVAGPAGRVVGLDADPVHARKIGSRMDYVVGRLENAPFLDGSFDCVLAMDVLEHLDDDTAGLREAARLVKRGGKLVVTVPAFQHLWGSQDVVNQHRRRYTKRMLYCTFNKAHLPRPRVTYFNMIFFPPIALIRWTRRALGLAGRSRSDFEGSQPGLVNEVLRSIFASEKYLIRRLRLPIGVSLLATMQR
jgi:2-polyprenyl-3-methyl-5-hydroxy-6-metoxy-1,4-benzoquinol methylase